ncbi:hypothetical protein, partial [Bacillus sp. B4EP4a]|uniref:hypothetical protein n=1 Tax=Bacillus sp. B4EP4a TaxID=2590665 RepID=UPI0015EE4830
TGDHGDDRTCFFLAEKEIRFILYQVIIRCTNPVHTFQHTITCFLNDTELIGVLHFIILNIGGLFRRLPIYIDFVYIGFFAVWIIQIIIFIIHI